MSINVKVGDRWSIVGATGSGKTVLARTLLWTNAVQTKGYVPLYILDSKCPMSKPQKSDFKDFFKKGFGKRHIGNSIPSPIDPRGSNFAQVWTPESDDTDMYDEWLRRIYKSEEPAIVFIDELSNLTNGNGTKYPRHFDILLKQGRGLDQGMIVLTQAPSSIPGQLIRQSTHIVRMHLNSDYDVTKLAKPMGRAIEQEPPDDYGFYYRNVQKPMHKAPTVYYRDMQEFFGLEG